jgi:triacylglycerol esterase/lipase EstA (alpha/beta hydrolase family)
LLLTAVAAFATVALSAGTASAATTTATAKYPVAYTFGAAIPAALNVNASPPGANDWNCKPSARHPEPVVLTHGILGNRNDNWQTFSPLLANEGYCVFALTYGLLPGEPLPLNQVGGRGPMEKSAAQLAMFVDKVRAATGSSKVDILGHSEGTLMPSYYVKFLGGAKKVDKYVALAPLYDGTNLAGLSSAYRLGKVFGVSPVVDGVLSPLCAACTQLLHSSDYVTKLHNAGVYGPEVTYTNIVTKYDELVAPYTSGVRKAPNATNIVLQKGCSADNSEHFAIVADPRAADYVLNALDPAHPRPVRCLFVPPFLG